MNKNITLLLIIILIASSPLLLFSQNDTVYLEEIFVEGRKSENILKTNISAQTLPTEQVHDVGEMFENEAGFGIVKRGNYAMEPVLRGFKYSQLNVQYDGGSKSSNACPNRMDPAISQISPEEIEKIEVIKGPYSVRFGPSVGGLINLVTKGPGYSNKFKISGMVEGGYMTNGGNFYGQAGVQMANKGYDFSVHADYKNFGNYKSGDGTEIPSSFTRTGYSIKIGNYHGKNKQNRIQLTLRQGFAKDVKHAGLPMDADKDNSSMLYLDYLANDISDLIFSLRAKVYGSYVDHEMSTRARPSWAFTESVAPVTSKSMGGRLEFGLRPGDKIIQYAGIDYGYINKDGQRNRLVKINSCTGDTLPQPKSFVDLIWQNSKSSDIGLFFENKYRVSSNLMWDVGFRLDFVEVKIDNPAPDFNELYNGNIQPDNDFNISANTSLTWQPDKNFTLQWAVGRGVRSASLLERFINHLAVGSDAYEYVGNPNLKPEANHQTDLIAKKSFDNFNINADLFYSYVTDYITAFVDTTIDKKFMPCKPPAHAKRFTNIDEAMLYGFELGFDITFIDHLNFAASGGYTYAQNITWDEPLPETPPFSGNASFKYFSDKVEAMIKVRFAADQTRVASSFAETTTPGWAVIDLGATYKPVSSFEIRASIANLLNNNYVEHLSRAYKNMGPETNSLFYEPGLSFNISATYRF
jgi:iron complex outermembrane receptor protein